MLDFLDDAETLLIVDGGDTLASAAKTVVVLSPQELTKSVCELSQSAVLFVGMHSDKALSASVQGALSQVLTHLVTT